MASICQYSFRKLVQSGISCFSEQYRRASIWLPSRLGIPCQQYYGVQKSDKCSTGEKVAKKEKKQKGCKNNGKKDGRKGKSKNKNWAAVLHAVNDMRLEERPIPKPGQGEVVVAMDSVGICGSDVHFLEAGKIGSWALQAPMIIGHEGAGVVAKIGRGVKTLKEGDRVAIEPGIPCRMCMQCKKGRYHLCPDVVFSAAPPHDGLLTNFQKHAADFCFKLPDHITMEEGALMEPLAVAVHACRQAKVSLNSDVLIIGGGNIGLLTILTAKAMGATNVIVTDVRKDRLVLAEKMGATHTKVICNNYTAADMACEVIKEFGVPPNKTFDCCGTESAVQLAVLCTRPAGTIILVGLAKSIVPFPMIEACAKELSIRGSFRYANDHPATRALVSSGALGSNLKRLISHHFDMKDTIEAFETARKREAGTMKVMIHVQPRDKNNTTKFEV